jgi:hypothetical protein
MEIPEKKMILKKKFFMDMRLCVLLFSISAFSFLFNTTREEKINYWLSLLIGVPFWGIGVLCLIFDIRNYKIACSLLRPFWSNVALYVRIVIYTGLFTTATLYYQITLERKYTLDFRWVTCILMFIFWASICYILYTAHRLKGIAPFRKAHIRVLMLCFNVVFIIASVVGIFAYNYMQYGVTNNKGIVFTDLNTCLYFSVATFATMSYGDFIPTQASRGLAACESIIGYLMLGVLIGTCVYVLTEVNTNTKQT